MTDLVILEAVGKTYSGVNAVGAVSLTVPAGQRLAVIGPNGAGKSTLFGMVAGEHRPTRGRVWFDGRDVTGWVPSQRAAAGISRTFQVARLFTSMTVRENVFMAALAHKGAPRSWDRLTGHREIWSEVDNLLERTSLASIANRSAATLAQGARKTLEMAMAVVQRPKLLLLDEPTAGMSYDDARAAVRVLRSLLDDDPNLTMIVTAHDMEVVFALAERVVLMARGEKVLDGTPTDVAAHPKTKEIYLGTSA